MITNLTRFNLVNGNNASKSNLNTLSILSEIVSVDKKAALSSLINTPIGNLFLIGLIVFVCLVFISIYLDTSLRNQIFYVFDNCTNEDYNYEYVVKIRFGLTPEFNTSNSDLIIEFFNGKFKPLSKFIINGNYLENGLNIGTKLCTGMKITSLYLFKYNSLKGLEFCRAYLNIEDPSVKIHLYSIEVGDNKEVQV